MNYKDNLIEKVGGQSQFDFAVIKYCENIQDDYRVSVFFEDMDLNGLIDLQKEFLNTALLDLSAQESEAAMGRLVVKYQRLWQTGLNARYFNVLKAHFIAALRDCWVEDSSLKLFDQHYDSLRPLFQEVMSDKEIQEKVAANLIQISIAPSRSITFRLGGAAHGSRRR
ncbi:MAG: hypothetical protein SGBAC_011252 [Bacillariaceae sp.]